MRRERVFLAVALALPVALVGAVEAVVRNVWDGGVIPVFVDAPVGDGRYVMPNPRLAVRWFPGEARPPAPSPELMRREKPARGLRVFVLGESAAQGFPYPRIGAFSRGLGALLRAAMPGDTVEVINLGIAATNSFATLDIVDELSAYAPDAIVYYGGHNEYYGAYGAGSSVGIPGSPGVGRFFLRLQSWHTVRLVNQLVARARARAAAPANPEAAAAADANFMGAVARDRAIEFGGRVYHRGVAQYEGNLRRVVRAARARGIPVYLASVASNERSHRPFVAAENAVADSVFGAATVALQRGDTATARDAFARARDLDQIRFRAPGAFVDVARRVAAEEGAIYVPVAEAFAAAAPGAMPGAESFLEHVHPNAAGSWLIARTVFAGMQASPPAGVAIAPVTPADEARYREGRGLTPFDTLVVSHRLRALTARWPFVAADAQGDYFGTYRPTDGYDSLAFFVAAGATSWEAAKMDVARRLEAAGDPGAALANYRSVMVDSPEFGAPWLASSELLVRAGRPAAADSVLAEAMSVAPTVAFAMARAQIASRDRRWRDAIRHLQFALSRQPTDPEVLYRMSLTSALAGDTLTARTMALRLARQSPTAPVHREWVRMLLSAP